MSLGTPSQEDIRKIHAEITQIVNQRLRLTTFAITLFGGILAWVIPKDAPKHSPLGAVTIYATLLLTVVLFALYLFGHVLRSMLRTFTTYLVATKSSPWEQDWERYRSNGYTGYTKAQTLIFLMLGILSTSSPWALSKVFELQVDPTHLKFEAIAGLGYVGLVTMMGFFGVPDTERRAKDKWKRLQKPHVIVVGLGAYFRKLQHGIAQHFETIQLIDERSHPLSLSAIDQKKCLQLSIGLDAIPVDSSVDCVMILTPPAVHVRQLERASGDKAILIEKPLATSARLIPRIQTAVARNPRIYCSDDYVDVRATPLLSWLFRDRYLPLRSALRVSGDRDLWQSDPTVFGTLERVSATLVEKEGFEGRPWLAECEQGGVVLDLMYHYFTLLFEIFEVQPAFETASLKIRQNDGSLVPWRSELGGETYALVDGLVQGVPFRCEVSKYWPGEESSEFTLHYSRGNAVMVFKNANTLHLRGPRSECSISLVGAHHDHAVACFAEYVKGSRTQPEPHGLLRAFAALECADRVKRLARI